jgi:hypothetical protein
MEQSPCFRNWESLSYSKNSPPCMKSKGSILQSQDHTLISILRQLNPLHTLMPSLFKIHFNTLMSTIRSQVAASFQIFWLNFLYASLNSLMHATCPTQILLIHANGITALKSIQLGRLYTCTKRLFKLKIIWCSELFSGMYCHVK